MSRENLTPAEMEHIEEEHDGTAINVTSVKVSASEKVSTGDYENYQPHTTMEAEVISTGSWESQRGEVLQTILGMQQDLQATLEHACEAKLGHLPASEQDDWMLESLLEERADD